VTWERRRRSASSHGFTQGMQHATMRGTLNQGRQIHPGKDPKREDDGHGTDDPTTSRNHLRFSSDYDVTYRAILSWSGPAQLQSALKCRCPLTELSGVNVSA
jgi:hypothetical protein